MSDAEILAFAINEEAIVITSDKDFGEMVFRQKLPHKGILLIRTELENYDILRLILEHIIQEHGESLKGKFTVYQHHKIRIR